MDKGHGSCYLSYIIHELFIDSLLSHDDSEYVTGINVSVYNVSVPSS